MADISIGDCNPVRLGTMPSLPALPTVARAELDALRDQFVTWVEVRRRASTQGLEQLSRQFLAWLKIRRSAKTVETYAVALELFCEFTADRGIEIAADVDHQAVEQFLAWLLDRGVSPKTVNNRLAALRSFWRWMRRNGITLSNVPADCERLPMRKSLPRYLSIEDTEKFLAGLAARPGAVARRDEAIIATALLAGLRCSELVGLRLADVNLKDNILRVVGKGDKEREFPIVPRLAKLLNAYLQETRQLLLEPTPLTGSEWFFVSANPTREASGAKRAGRAVGAQLGRHAFNGQLRKISREVLGRHVHPHMLRHSFASRLRERGADLQLIGEALGHESIDTTQIYAHLATSHRRKLLQGFLTE